MAESSSSSVYLYVYDISNGMAKQFGPMVGLQLEGIWHTGIVVFGREYFYGGGITYDMPGRTPFGSPVKTIPLGETQIPQVLFHDFLEGIADQYTEYTYDLLKHNCNNFTNHCSTFLIGSGIPDDIVSLPNRVMSSPIGGMLRPALENMQNQLKQYRGQNSIASRGPGQQAYAEPVQQPPALKNTGRPRFSVSDPQHPHEALAVQAIPYWKPYLFKVGNQDRIIETLTTNLTNSGHALSDDDKATVEQIRKFVAGVQATPPTTEPLPATIIQFLSVIEAALKEETIFPYYDLLRFLVLDETVCQHYISQAAGLSGLLSQIQSESSPFPFKLTALRFINNLFVLPRGGSLLSTTPIIDAILEIQNYILTLPKETKMYSQLRETVLVLGYNLSLFVARDDSDQTAQIISSTLFHLQEEQNDENAFHMLMTLGHLIYTNTAGVELVDTLGLETERWEKSQLQKVKNVVADIKLVLTTQ